MDNIINDDTERHIEEIARDSIFQLKPICEDCWSDNIDDPLGSKSDTNTSCNKSMEAIVNHIIDTTETLTKEDFTTIKSKLSSLFYEDRNNLINESDKLIQNELKCTYCFEDRITNDNELSILLEDIEGKSKHLFGRENNQWR